MCRDDDLSEFGMLLISFVAYVAPKDIHALKLSSL